MDCIRRDAIEIAIWLISIPFVPHENDEEVLDVDDSFPYRYNSILSAADSAVFCGPNGSLFYKMIRMKAITKAKKWI
jgi:hypothetical protein